MTSTKAIELLSMQLDKINQLDSNNYSAWQSQTSSYIKDIFGESSEEYEFIKGFRFTSWASDNSYNYQIRQNSQPIKIFLDNCIESIEHRGLQKPKTDSTTPKEHWSKRHPILFEIVKALIILTAGYFFRYFTEPKGSQQENKTTTSQSPSK